MFEKRIYTILITILFANVIMFSCTANTTKSKTPITRTAEEVLNLSGLAMQGTSSFEFELSHKNTTGTQIGNLVFSKARGIISSHNSMLVEGNFLFGNLNLSGKLITINNEIFFLNPVTQKWERTDGSVTLLSFFNPEKGIQKILDSIYSPSFESNSKTYWNIKGYMPAYSLSNIIGETTKNDVAVTIWIDKTTNHLNRAIIYGKLNDYDKPETNNPIQRIITISKIDEDLVIEHPLK